MTAAQPREGTSIAHNSRIHSNQRGQCQRAGTRCTHSAQNSWAAPGPVRSAALPSVACPEQDIPHDAFRQCGRTSQGQTKVLCAGWLAALRRPAACVSVAITPTAQRRHPGLWPAEVQAAIPSCAPGSERLFLSCEASFGLSEGSGDGEETAHPSHSNSSLTSGDAPSQSGWGGGRERHVLPLVLKPRWGGGMSYSHLIPPAALMSPSD